MGTVVRIIGIAVVVLGVAVLIFITKQSTVISPVPEEGAIRIIYLTPSPTGSVSPTGVKGQ